MLNLRCIEASGLWDVLTRTHRTANLSIYGKERENYSDHFLNFNQAFSALAGLTGDGYLTNMFNYDDPVGYTVFKEANSAAGIDVDGLTEFATAELRMRSLQEFFAGLSLSARAPLVSLAWPNPTS